MGSFNLISQNYERKMGFNNLKKKEVRKVSIRVTENQDPLCEQLPEETCICKFQQMHFIKPLDVLFIRLSFICTDIPVETQSHLRERPVKFIFTAKKVKPVSQNNK